MSPYLPRRITAIPNYLSALCTIDGASPGCGFSFITYHKILYPILDGTLWFSRVGQNTCSLCRNEYSHSIVDPVMYNAASPRLLELVLHEVRVKNYGIRTEQAHTVG